MSFEGNVVVPKHYYIDLSPDLHTGVFKGREDIVVTVHEATKEVVLHAQELDVGPHVYVKLGHDEIPINWGSVAKEGADRIRVTFDKEIQPGEWVLALWFDGTLNNKLHGFYRSRYRDAETGEEKLIASTQFEATDARRAFPCWDKPDLKATFEISLTVRDPDITVLSNTKVVKARICGGNNELKKVWFAPTIPMSTYLVAFTVGDFESSEPVCTGRNNTEIRIWCVRDKKHLTHFAWDAASFFLREYEEYYNRAYPGDKLDLIAIPDFASGAMENLGAITFRETALLIDEKTASQKELQWVADVVAHEVAHMWFGDLVTMRWWNGIWLNEAFATFMEAMMVNRWKPEWRRWESFAVERVAALALGGLRTARPIEFKVEKADECQAMFDPLTYEGGASILRMFEQYLTPPVFQRGIAAYIKKHEYGNTETKDLFDALSESSGKDVDGLMRDWIFKPGYPLLRVSDGGGYISISQSRFSYLELSPEAASQRWFIPVGIRYSNKAEDVRELKHLLCGDHFDFREDTEWFLANAGGVGYYRVVYDPPLLKRLLANLEELTPTEQFCLIDDAWAAVRAGAMELAEYLDMLPHFRNIPDKNIWSVIAQSLSFLYRVAVETGSGVPFRQFVENLMRPLLIRLGWQATEGEDPLWGSLRSLVIATLGTIGSDGKVRVEAQRRFIKYWNRNEAGMDADIRDGVFSVAAFIGNTPEYEKLLRGMQDAKTPQLEQLCRYSLAQFIKPVFVQQTLAMLLDGTFRTQDAPYTMYHMLYNADADAQKMAWEFLVSHWDEMLQKYPDNSIIRMCEGVVALSSPEMADQARAFFAGKEVPEGTLRMPQILERLQIAERLHKKAAKELPQYLKNE